MYGRQTKNDGWVALDRWVDNVLGLFGHNALPRYDGRERQVLVHGRFDGVLETVHITAPLTDESRIDHHLWIVRSMMWEILTLMRQTDL